MKPFTQRNPVPLAVIGITVVVTLLALAFNFQRLPLVGQGPTYHAELSDASGLRTGDDVRMAGVKVGDVTGVDIDGGHVVADFTVKDASFGERTKASVELLTLLGQHYLSLEPDGRGQLDAGATIPLARTSTPMNVQPTLENLTSTVGQIDVPSVTRAFDSLSATLADAGPQLRPALDGISALSRTVASRDTQLGELFAKARGVTGALASRSGQLGPLVGSTNQVLEVLHQRKDTIHEVLTGVRGLSAQLTGLVRDNEAQLGPALGRLREVTEVLQRNDRQLDQILSTLPVYVREFTNVVGAGRWFDMALHLPRGFGVCDTGAAGPLSAVLSPALSQANQLFNNSSAPCLPLGPAANTAGSAGSQGAPPGGPR
jgi:phospholipid/cholesterol/gamma-HCH transport system substrate-binding protein